MSIRCITIKIIIIVLRVVVECYETQRAFISECDLKQRRTDYLPAIKRALIRNYVIEYITVCRDMFVKTLAISTK